jgi:hypothetical protein
MEMWRLVLGRSVITREDRLGVAEQDWGWVVREMFDWKKFI